MFQLIISIIAVALIAVLSGASIFYGASAFINNKLKTEAITLINNSEQIESAMRIYKSNTGNELTAGYSYAEEMGTATSELINEGYLKQDPSPYYILKGMPNDEFSYRYLKPNDNDPSKDRAIMSILYKDNIIDANIEKATKICEEIFKINNDSLVMPELTGNPEAVTLDNVIRHKVDCFKVFLGPRTFIVFLRKI